jgi:hypothetical protein
MKSFVQSEVTERYSRLPEAVRVIATSDAVSFALADALEATGLPEVRQAECKKQITLVAVGLATFTELSEYVKSELTLSPEKVSALLDTLEHSVFTPIRSALQQSLATKNSLSQDGSRVTKALPLHTFVSSTRDPSDPYAEPID